MKFKTLFICLTMMFTACCSRQNHQGADHHKEISHELKAKNPLRVQFLDKDLIHFESLHEGDFELKVFLYNPQEEKKLVYETSLSSSKKLKFDLPENFADFVFLSAVVKALPQGFRAVDVYKIGEQEEINKAKASIQK